MSTDLSGDVVFPRKLRVGDHLRVVAPSRSRGIIRADVRARADQVLGELGLTVSFGANVDVMDRFASSPVEGRVEDLHAAFADPEVDGILTVIGGYNSHQLLPHLDMGLVRANPKVLCGYSDITALQHGLLVGAGLVTYSGPHWSTFGLTTPLDDVRRWFRACLFEDGPVELHPSDAWNDDDWDVPLEEREVCSNDGPWVLREGRVEGRLLGGNASTLALLNGTRWFPDLAGAVLLLEADAETKPVHLDRWLTSILQQPGASAIAGLLVGRFQLGSGIERDDLVAMLGGRPELADIPVVANLDVGHTTPMWTYPVGGSIRVEATADQTAITLTRH